MLLNPPLEIKLEIGRREKKLSISKSSVRRAGSQLRQFFNGEISDTSILDRSLSTITRYRAEYVQPVNNISSELNQICTALFTNFEVTSRIKKVSTIIDKVTNRERNIDLSRMQDIGGCRVVVSSIEEVRICEAALLHFYNPIIKNHIDYISSPRSSGYRGIHIVIDTKNVLIEIQLRTVRIHRWALVVEDLSNKLDENFKTSGDTVVHRYLKAYALLEAFFDKNQNPPPQLHKEVNLLKIDVDNLLVAREQKNR